MRRCRRANLADVDPTEDHVQVDTRKAKTVLKVASAVTLGVVTTRDSINRRAVSVGRVVARILKKVSAAVLEQAVPATVKADRAVEQDMDRAKREIDAANHRNNSTINREATHRDRLDLDTVLTKANGVLHGDIKMSKRTSRPSPILWTMISAVDVVGSSRTKRQSRRSISVPRALRVQQVVHARSDGEMLRTMRHLNRNEAGAIRSNGVRLVGHKDREVMDKRAIVNFPLAGVVSGLLHRHGR